MSQAFYRKYRSKKLSEIVGQEHITDTLSRAIKAGNISHAYLFTGPKGVGKTSVARILAHEINQLPYDDEQSHIDIIEIDAASNRRIDEIRDIRDKVHIAPAVGKYKVYIIDEVHMLTKEAFNALLKTLEEPPSHVVFVLATTEAHKLPETIISRTQRYNFKPITELSAINHLQEIAKNEAVEIDNESLELIAKHGHGSFRDSISLLDQLASNGERISGDKVRILLGLPDNQAVEALYECMSNGQPIELLEMLMDLRVRGINSTTLASELSAMVRDKLIAGSVPSPDLHLELLDKLVNVPAKAKPDEYLELAILGLNLTINPPQPASGLLKQLEPKTPKDSKVDKQMTQPKPEKPITKIDISAQTVKPPSKPVSELNDELWAQVLAEIKKDYATIYGIMRMSRPSLNNGELLLEFGFPFHLKQVEQAANRHKVLTVIEKHFGDKTVVNMAVNTSLGRSEVAAETPQSNDDIGSITNIFGGGEVLES